MLEDNNNTRKSRGYRSRLRSRETNSNESSLLKSRRGS